MTRTLRLLAVAASAALLATGCGPVQAGAAATVGEERITTAQLDALVTRSLADPTAKQSVGADRAGFERVALRRMIDHDILAKAAEQEKVTVTPGEVAATRDRIAAQIGGEAGLKAEALKAGIAPKDLDQTLADVTLRDALGDKLTAAVPVPDSELALAYQRNLKDYDQVHSAHILVASKPQALGLLAQVKAHPDQFATLASKFSIDAGTKTIGGDLGFQGRGALEKSFETAIFTHPAGSFVLAQTQYGFHVIRVMEHRVTTLEQAKPALRRGLLGQQRSEAVQALLLKTATDLDIKVNPRFGTWNAKTLDVVAPKTSTDSPVSPSPRPGDASQAPVTPVGP